MDEISSQKILKNNNLKFDSFDKNYAFLAKESLSYSMGMIKSDLTKLGISHDSFVSEKSIVDSDGVTKAIKQLKKAKHIEEGYLEPPKGEENQNWKKVIMETSQKTAREIYLELKGNLSRKRFGFGKKAILVNIDLQKDSKTKPIYEYMQRVFTKPCFINSLSELERDIRSI